MHKKNYTKCNIKCKKYKFTENFKTIRVYASNIKPFKCNILYSFRTVSYKKSESVLCTFKKLCRVQIFNIIFRLLEIYNMYNLATQ